MIAIRELAQVKLADPLDEAIPIGSIPLTFLRECVALGIIVDTVSFRISRPREALFPFTPSERNGGLNSFGSPDQGTERGDCRWCREISSKLGGTPSALSMFTRKEIRRDHSTGGGDSARKIGQSLVAI
jgi:hypothetical protein